MYQKLESPYGWLEIFSLNFKKVTEKWKYLVLSQNGL